ncbi:serine/threonine-protein phosphatase 6 regulatory ankyrin repeat subunit B-like [Ylistrum balloti]|uniref:serine/threonine-protein phosphatase 6 regulatory ankyrin repeat subunit B-like n=1 Tax=Ylistrum balloti TaxID=509963 RepID=UPI002905A0EF|nr:serine/threonine-protein phosphatase 6 regulatory ankyrin repeat subunit B-like [Ylistrum balloti]
MAGEMHQLAQTKIGCAIKEGDPGKLKMLLQAGEDVHFKDRKGNTYLHYVSSMNRPAVFHIIAASGIDVNLQNKHGHTPLHVTALQRQSGHLGDLMCWGADPSIVALNMKTPEEVNPQDKYWHKVYDKYKPGIFQAVKNHDVERVKELLHCWCKTDSEKNGQTLRQFAAAHKHHDIVSILDRHRATMDAIYGVLEFDYDKLKRGLKKTRCDVNFLNWASQKQHILQHAIQLRDYRLVQMLCDAGADVNVHVRLKNYFRAPLYFEAISPEMKPDIMWKILESNANFHLKDERGRNAMLYALDRDRGFMSLDIFRYIIENGGNVADRDETGVTIRDTARFARRPDIINYIDKCYVKMIRTSDIEKLQGLATDGYDSMLITYNVSVGYRDSFIYAAGNETDDALKFIEWLPTFQNETNSLQHSIRHAPLSSVRDIVESCQSPDMLVNCRDKAMRTPLILACLFAREDVIKYLLGFSAVIVNSTDCCDRSCLHYSYMLGEDGDSIRKLLISAGINTDQKDTNGRLAQDYTNIREKERWLKEEKHAKYGMELELLCVDKYEELYKLIRGKRKGLKDFADCIRYFPFPVAMFPKILGPLMPGFRDLIFLAIDYGKEDICIRLADIGADLFRKEKYTVKTDDGEDKPVYMTAAERAWDLYMNDVAALLSRKQEFRRHQPKTLLPKRIHARFQEAIALKPVLFRSVFLDKHL